MNLRYIRPSKQHIEFTDAILRYFIPGKTSRIIADGNCLFRTLAYSLTGSEKSHMKVRDLLCGYMAGVGQENCRNYVKNRFAKKDIVKLKNTFALTKMINEYIWGTDCEILAAAYLFGVHIFIAIISKRKQCSKMIWHKYAFTEKSALDPGLYIVNENYHYEPVRQAK